jgi:hypothetical protein
MQLFQCWTNANHESRGYHRCEGSTRSAISGAAAGGAKATTLDQVLVRCVYGRTSLTAEGALYQHPSDPEGVKYRGIAAMTLAAACPATPKSVSQIGPGRPPNVAGELKSFKWSGQRHPTPPPKTCHIVSGVGYQGALGRYTPRSPTKSSSDLHAPTLSPDDICLHARFCEARCVFCGSKSPGTQIDFGLPHSVNSRCRYDGETTHNLVRCCAQAEPGRYVAYSCGGDSPAWTPSS